MARLAASFGSGRAAGSAGVLADAAEAGRAPLDLPRDANLRPRRLPGRVLRCCAGGSNSAMSTNRLCFPAKGMPGRYLTCTLAFLRLWSKYGTGMGLLALTRAKPPLKGARSLPRRLTARLRILIPSIEVRILAGHPFSAISELGSPGSAPEASGSRGGSRP